MTRRTSIKLTSNFEANLAIIEAYWIEHDFPQAYDHLLDQLGTTVIPNLERFPAMGRSFMTRQPESVEALSEQEKLRARLARLGADSEIREYITADYLLLYAIINEGIYLLSIRHHKQVSFDFAQLWLDHN